MLFWFHGAAGFIVLQDGVVVQKLRDKVKRSHQTERRADAPEPR